MYICNQIFGMKSHSIIPYYFESDGVIPNNPLPVLIYKQVMQDFETTFRKNAWSNNWKDIILPYDHFHSNTHEVLALVEGTAKLKIGGKHGIELRVESGDVIIIPAGVGHYSVDNSLRYQFVGGYPNGADWNLRQSLEEDSLILDEIGNIPLPTTDPIFGVEGPLFDYWK